MYRTWRGPIDCIPWMCMISANVAYRRAIMHALDFIQAQGDIHSHLRRSPYDQENIRRRTKLALIELDLDRTTVWNEILFRRTLKSIEDDEYHQNLAENPMYQSLSQSTVPSNNTTSGRSHEKVAPRRPREHDKWKIMPKRVFDKTA
jgi:hypothetical protein